MSRIDDAESGSERPELPAGLQDRDGEPARQPRSGGARLRPRSRRRRRVSSASAFPAENGPARIVSLGQPSGKPEFAPAREARHDPPVERGDELTNSRRVIRREAARPDDDGPVRSALEIDADRPVENACRGHDVGRGPHAQRPSELLAEVAGVSEEPRRRRPRPSPAAMAFRAFSRVNDENSRSPASWDRLSSAGMGISKASAVMQKEPSEMLPFQERGQEDPGRSQPQAHPSRLPGVRSRRAPSSAEPDEDGGPDESVDDPVGQENEVRPANDE